MKAEVYPSKDGWRFRVNGDNGEIMCVGEAYVRRIDAESALRQLFGIRRSLDVTIRGHSAKVVDHYMVTTMATADELYTDTTLLGPDDEP